jgi:hypothetical protein
MKKKIIGHQEPKKYHASHNANAHTQFTRLTNAFSKKLKTTIQLLDFILYITTSLKSIRR